jgi:tellurite resistance-related uncharacterized protein
MNSFPSLPHLNLIQKAKAMLPNMPDEVFNTWLLPIIRHHNSWPYDNILSPHPTDQWRRYFGLFTLHDFSECVWYRMRLTFDMGCLDPISDSVIQTLIEKHIKNRNTPGRLNVLNSKSRFLGFVEFIQRTRTIPAPIIGINTGNGLRILDGNHRIAALTHLKLRGTILCDTWIASDK